MSIGRRVEVLVDASAKLSYADVISSRHAHQFKRSTQEIPSYGITRAAVWVRFVVVNRGSARQTWLLDTHQALHVDHVDFYCRRVRSGPAELRSVKTGIARPWASRDVSHRNFVFRVTLNPGQQRVVHLRFHGANEIVFPLVLYSEPAFGEKDQRELLGHGLYFGVLLIMVLFNLLMAIALRDRTYGWYVIYIGCFAVWMLAVTEVGLQFLWSNSGYFGQRFVFLFGWFASAAAVQFAREFLGTRIRAPHWDLALRVAMGINLAVPALAVGLSWRLSNQLASLVLVTEPLMIAATAALIWRRGYRPARFYLLAWSTLFAAWIFAGLYIVGALGADGLARNPLFIMEVGSGLEAALLALALADRINTLKGSRDEARARATIAQQFTRYFPRTLVERILNTELEVRLESQRRLVTTLFADLRGFTKLSDGLPPERVGALLNDYLGTMVELMEQHGCTLDKTMGDGVMGFYGAPGEMAAEDQAERSVRLALAMQQRMADLCQAWREGGLDHDILLRVGIHQDQVTVGHFGAEELLSYTVVGSGVNLAARLEGGATPGRILVSDSLHAMVNDTFPWEPPREQSFKGFSQAKRVHELDPAQVAPEIET